ncbi:MAG: lipocalin-like domain-containing protein [Leptospirillia bacterium]
MRSIRYFFPPLFFLILFWMTGAPNVHAAPSQGMWEDLLSHGDFPIEWWYMTGFLTTEKGKNLGFQATFFRMKNTQASSDKQSARGPWAPREIFGFHGAISNLSRKTFASTERERRGFDQSVATQDHPFSVRIGRNRLDHKNTNAFFLGLSFRVKNQSYDLKLTPLTPPIWHAAHKKFFTGPRPIDYAYYYSYPLVTVEGTRTIVHQDGSVTHERLHGQCWFDHEWMAQTLAPGQIGWIWLWAWNKENTQGIMLYQMLDRGGTLSPFHRATVMKRTKTGITLERTKDVFLVQGLNRGCVDLKKIQFLVDHTMKISVLPKIKDQMLKGAVSYWEGAARMGIGKDSGGEGYLEVTGFDKQKLSSENDKLCQSREKSP